MKLPRRRFLHLAASTIVPLVLSMQGAADAAEIKVLSAGAARQPQRELFSQFERVTGQKIVTEFDFGLSLKRRIEAGEAFDVAILTVDVDELIKQGKIAPGTRVVLGRTGVGVAVRKGAPKPDISTTEAFKHTLLNAKSVAYAKEGGSGVYFLSLLQRFGIADEMKGKLMPYPTAAGRTPSGGDGSVEAVAAGEADLAVNGTVVIAAVPGVDLVGGLPPELQTYVIFTAGVSARAKQAEAGRNLLTFLTTPAAIAVFKAGGLEPVAR
jgi:molybdate transport system substrate-binding protein